MFEGGKPVGAVRRLRPGKKRSAPLFKGAALFLLVVFAVQFSRQFWPFAMLAVGVWLAWWGARARVQAARRQVRVLAEAGSGTSEGLRGLAAESFHAQGFEGRAAAAAAPPAALVLRR